MKTVRLFGDSVLKGVVYDDVTGRYRLCKDKWQMPDTFQNLCKMGATSRWGKELSDRKADICGVGTVAVVEYGGNDCNYRWDDISRDPTQKPPCAVEPKEYVQNLEAITRTLRAGGADVVFTSLLPLDENAYMEHISRGLSYGNILTWLGTVHRLYEWQDYYNTLLTETAARLGCPVIPLRSALGDDAAKLLCADGIHPTEQGHAVIHRFMENALAAV